MNMIETQAEGLNKLFAGLPTPDKEYDVEMRRLRQITQTIRAIQPHMKAMGDALDRHDAPALLAKAEKLFRLEKLASLTELIHSASPFERKLIVNELIDAGSNLGEDVRKLEDYACTLTKEIDAQKLRKNPPLCSSCNGSGEGQYDGTRCMFCKGTGTSVTEEAADTLRAYTEARDEG